MTETKRLVLADPISPDGVALLEEGGLLEVVDVSGRSREELRSALAEAAGLIVRSGTRVDEEVLDAAAGLEVIGRAGVGVDNIDVEEATRRGIAVLNAPGGNTYSTAELAFGLILAATRRIAQADRSLREGRWDRAGLRGTQLHGKTLGVVGAGRIGTEMIRRGRGFGMSVLAHDPYVGPERIREAGAEPVELRELLSRADVVTLHAPLTDASRGMIGAEELAGMKAGAFLVNAARGGLVDEDALAEALSSSRIAGAALDVFESEPLPDDHPLRDAPNLVLTPHLGAATEEARREVAVEIARAVRDALLDGDLRAALNAPKVDPEERPRVDPVLDLGRHLGRLVSELVEGRCERLDVSYAGPHSGLLRALAARVAEGFLASSVDRPLNVVNALVVASERGIEVSRVRAGEATAYSNYVEVEASRGEEGHVVGGALLGEGHPRVVRIDEFHVDTVPRGTLLVVRNRDVPGVIGEVGTRLGRAGVNIAEYHQARRVAGGDALAVVTVDGAVPEDVLGAIRGLPNVEEVRQVAFGDA